MNNNEFEMDEVKPVEPVNPFYEETNPLVENYVEMQPQNQYAYSSQSEVMQESVMPVTPQPLEQEDSLSYAQMPIVDNLNPQIPTIDSDINENPNAKISLHNNIEENIPVSSTPIDEKVDKSTIWMLVILFIGLLAVIIALPYMYELF